MAKVALKRATSPTKSTSKDPKSSQPAKTTEPQTRRTSSKPTARRAGTPSRDAGTPVEKAVALFTEVAGIAPTILSGPDEPLVLGAELPDHLGNLRKYIVYRGISVKARSPKSRPDTEEIARLAQYVKVHLARMKEVSRLSGEDRKVLLDFNRACIMHASVGGQLEGLYLHVEDDWKLSQAKVDSVIEDIWMLEEDLMARILETRRLLTSFIPEDATNPEAEWLEMNKANRWRQVDIFEEEIPA